MVDNCFTCQAEKRKEREKGSKMHKNAKGKMVIWQSVSVVAATPSSSASSLPGEEREREENTWGHFFSLLLSVTQETKMKSSSTIVVQLEAESLTAPRIVMMMMMVMAMVMAIAIALGGDDVLATVTLMCTDFLPQILFSLSLFLYFYQLPFFSNKSSLNSSTFRAQMVCSTPRCVVPVYVKCGK